MVLLVRFPLLVFLPLAQVDLPAPMHPAENVLVIAIDGMDQALGVRGRALKGVVERCDQ